MKLFISILMLSQIIFSQCESQFYDESEYYYYPNLNESHVGSTLDCYYSTDWDILVELISLNNLSNMEVGELGYQNWDENGRLKNFTLDYSVSNSPQYIDQKINTLPENFGELEMLESLEMYYHNLTVFPISFPQLENLKALNMKGNRLKILNANFGSLSSLEVLDLGYNDLVALPESISGLINMNYFWIFGNDISYIPDSVCELDIDWSGESGDFIYFGSGGNHLCGDVPTCVESSLFFNIMLEEQGYAFQIESEQVCACNDGSYPDCEEQCPDAENYGSIIDACGVCNFPEDACISDCAGNWGSIAILDECGICDGDGSACEDVGTLSLIDDVDTWLVSYNSPFSISSIHFEVEGAIATTAMGFGSTMFFATSINEIIEGSFFPTVLSGEGTLLTVLFDGIPTSLNNITVTDANNTSHPFIFDDGNIEICDNGFDCLGECGGPAILDTCGICDGDGTSTWYADNDGDGLGDSQNSSSFCYEYENYVSNSNDTDDLEFCPYQYLDNNFDCFGNCIFEVDCAGVCGGSVIEDACGECGGNVIDSIDCILICEEGNTLGCDNICYPTGGELTLDECGICGGDDSSCLDCAEEPNGNAFENECGCVGGSTLLEEDFCIGCNDPAANNYCEDCSIICGLFTIPNDCCTYYVQGDVNFDGVLNILDVVSLVNYVLDIIPFSDEQVAVSDITQDDVINILDIVSLVNIILAS
ncbi:MAG: hypothetical protein HOA66_05590 [Candidatus Marinimicrobia bacterium]|nr:hypothetical protein [Candidatus Neomarinimicrobiota bacterium]